MKYFKLEGKKYQLAEARSVYVPELLDLYIDSHRFIKLKYGWLTLLEGFQWDGATGVPDGPDNMDGSAYHDALYELMRLGLLDRKYRDVADQLLRKICLKKGMDKFWADQFYNFVHALGESRTFPDKHPKGQIIET